VGFVKELREFADYRDAAKLPIEVATVAVTERYCRRTLRLKKRDPLAYRGLKLRCIGSARWRARAMS
jgi:hypothetical protein